MRARSAVRQGRLKCAAGWLCASLDITLETERFCGTVAGTDAYRNVSVVESLDCGDTRTCVGNACRPVCESDNQCTPLGLLCNRNVGYCVECLRHEDCSDSRHCASDACKTDVCTPGAKRCENNAVHTCDSAGSGWGTETCTSLQYCDNITKACANRVCTPNTPACNGTFATTCNSLGSGYTGTGTNCSNTGQYCVLGQCSNLLCAPNTYFCESGNVRRCAADGLSSTPSDTCTTGEYCAEGMSTCQPRVCTPNAPACNGNSRTTCNSTGSGYTGTSTPCGSLYCVSGTCQSALFVEDWEDGNSNDWLVRTGSYTTKAVQSTFAADGSTWSLLMTKTTSAGHNDGLGRTFSPAIQPARISWWTLVPQTVKEVGYFMLYPSATLTESDYIAWFYFNATAQISMRGNTTVLQPYVANRWYHIELRNINWVARTFDYYIDGVLIQSLGMTGPGTSIARLDLYNYGNGTAYWDEIEFQ